jgi:predicted esterase
VFVWAHGGSMITGDKAGGMEREWGNEFARRGWVFVSINYRLMSQFLPGDCVNDVICALSPRLPLALADGQHDMQAAVRWVRANAASLRLDPEEITVGGHSAGTALALRTNFAPDDPGTSGNPGFPSNVAAAVTNSGSLLEPTVVGPGEPPILMFNSSNDPDLTFPAGFVNACVATTLMGNVCEFHGYSTGGHSLSPHRADEFQVTSEFLCRRVVSGCGVAPDDATGFVGPSGSHWATDVQCDDNLVYAGPKGVELCTDGLVSPVQARAYVASQPQDATGETIDSIQLDGDPDNPLLHSSIHITGGPVTIVAGLIEIIADGISSLVPS